MPLGQCLQPDHTLAPVAIQGGDRPPRLQAPDVHQPIQGPVQASQEQGQQEVSEEGGHAQHTLQSPCGDHTAGGPGVSAARGFRLGDSSQYELKVKVARVPLPRGPSGASVGRLRQSLPLCRRSKGRY